MSQTATGSPIELRSKITRPTAKMLQILKLNIENSRIPGSIELIAKPNPPVN
jgi:hypothetical protein